MTCTTSRFSSHSSSSPSGLTTRCVTMVGDLLATLAAIIVAGTVSGGLNRQADRAARVGVALRDADLVSQSLDLRELARRVCE